jgi:hypothetical protein
MRNRLSDVPAALALAIGVSLSSPGVHAQVLDTLDTIGPYLDGCVIRRLSGAGFSADRELTLRLSFRRDGTIIGVPQTTYSRPSKEDPEQARFITTVQQAFADCTPVPFSKPLGASIAGRIFTFRYTVERQKDQNT